MLKAIGPLELLIILVVLIIIILMAMGIYFKGKDSGRREEQRRIDSSASRKPEDKN